jgi:hypothetical protein
MKVLEKLSPEWFDLTSKKLDHLEATKDDYNDPEEGDKAPTKEIFQVVRDFLGMLRDKNEKLEEPNLFISPNGHIVVVFGTKKRSLDVRFTPEAHYYFKDSSEAPSSGKGVEGAVELAFKYFRI